MDTQFNMQFIDPQLLADEPQYTQSPTQFEQAEFSFSDYLYTDTVDAMAHFNPYADYSVYPEMPLMMNSHFMQPDSQPGFGPEYFIGPQPVNPRYVNASTQTGPNVPAASQPAKPKTLASSRYALRYRKPIPRAQSNTKAAEEVKQKRKARKYIRRQALDSSCPFQPEDMPEPLSILAANLENPDIDAYVLRSAEGRIVKGKITRPLNIFMLYRKAYGKSVLELFPYKNNQAVSTIVGISWRKESKEIQDRFRNLATLESDTHNAMFPNYKYLSANQAEYPLPITPESANSPSESSGLSDYEEY